MSSRAEQALEEAAAAVAVLLDTARWEQERAMAAAATRAEQWRALEGQLAMELASISRDGGGASSKSGEGEEVEPEVEVQRADDTAVVE